MRWFWSIAVCALGFGAGIGLLTSILDVRAASAEGPYAISISLQLRATTCTKTLAQSPNAVTSMSADGVSATYSLCVYVENTSTGLPIDGAPVEIRTIVGTVGVSGTARYSGFLFTTGGGVTSISYRGNGRTFGGDTIVATYGGTRAVATTTITLRPAAGRFPTSIVIVNPSTRVIAASRFDSSQAYRSPRVGVNVAVQVQNMNGLGVNNQVLIVRSEGARLVANAAMAQTATAACGATNARALVLTTDAANVLVESGIAMPGTVNFSVCADPEQEGSEVHVLVEAVTVQLPAADLILDSVGRPATISAHFDGNTLTTSVADASGHPVADGTPVRIVLPPSLGTVSSSCVTTRNGAASVAAAVAVPLATALVTADYNEFGAVASCDAPGTRFVATSLPIGSLGVAGTTGG